MRDRSQGFILVSALAVLATLSALVGAGALLVQAELAEANLAKEDLTQDALAHAGLELAAYQAFRLGHPPAAISGQRIRLSSGVATLSVSAENGKVDLNGASAELLAGLWRAIGETSITAEAFANRVVDWRDPDDARGLFGAERIDYAAKGAAGPANAAFQSEDDVRHVLGVTESAARLLEPHLTVGNPKGVVSAATASRTVLRALPNADATMVERVVEFQRGGDLERLDALLADRGVAAEIGSGKALRIAVAAAGRLRTDLRTFRALKGLDDSTLFTIVEQHRAFAGDAGPVD